MENMRMLSCAIEYLKIVVEILLIKLNMKKWSGAVEYWSECMEHDQAVLCVKKCRSRFRKTRQLPLKEVYTEPNLLST